MSGYNPSNKTVELLDRAWELQSSVPYEVSARWLFYGLLQEGWYSKKSDYKNKFIKAISAARKSFYKEWQPDTLTDDTRKPITRGRGSDNVQQWAKEMARHTTCHLDKWVTQSHYIELWFEAKAMVGQFEYYTDHVTLRPMGGQPSIPYKWDIAKDLERCANWYHHPITILYFGDLDNAGGTIADTVQRDVTEWCDIEFDFINCGLTSEQVQRYNVPENPEKIGEYQWEALSDQGAQEIIKGATDKFLRQGAFSKVVSQEAPATRQMREHIKSFSFIND